MIRKAERADLPALLTIAEAARAYMARTGNPNQWGGGYPDLYLEEDIALGRLYVLTDGAGAPHAFFALLLGEEPSYAAIHGAWLNARPYGTIHRMASDGALHGVFARCLEFCLDVCPNLRADTHADNATMRHLLEKYGFVRCGTVNLDLREGDTLRIAYQREG